MNINAFNIDAGHPVPSVDSLLTMSGLPPADLLAMWAVCMFEFCLLLQFSSLDCFFPVYIQPPHEVY